MNHEDTKGAKGRGFRGIWVGDDELLFHAKTLRSKGANKRVKGNSQKVFIRLVFTHAEYDKEDWKNDPWNT